MATVNVAKITFEYELKFLKAENLSYYYWRIHIKKKNTTKREVA